MAIRAILYDNDGTLVDTHDLILASMRHATKAVLGREFPEEVLMHGVGTPLDTQLLELADGDEELGAELARVYREHNHSIHDQSISLFAGVADGLRALHDAGLKQGVVTAKRHWLAQHGLEVMGVWEHLDCLIGADDCPKAKPDPDPIVMAADVLGVSPQECVYLGDSPYDMQAGLAAGCVTVAALWGMFPQDVLESFGPAASCATFGEFAEYAMDMAR